MASDRLALVQFAAPHYEAARPTVLRVLTDGVARIAPDGGPQLTPAERDRGNIRLDAPWAGEIATLDRHGNARLTFTLRVMATDPIAEVDGIVAAILTAPSRSAIEWRRDGTSRPTYYPLRGDADWTPEYSMRGRQQGAGMTVRVGCEVAPYSHHGSMDIFDGFDTNTLSDWAQDQ